ncbi:MAG TPA: bifunctional DNA primase/polymerase [Pseudonocardiaceae bacterium]
MDWSDSWRGAFRIELRAQAIGLAYRGWPVLPGTYPAGSRWAGGGTDASQTGPSPVHEDWPQRVGATADEVAEWWNGEAFSVLVATGTTLDAIEVGAELGRRTASVLRSAGQPVPIAATPQGRWLFLTAAGAALSGALAGHDDIVAHAAGSWIPLPPTAFEHGIVHWRVRPEVCGWELPAPHVVQDAMARALSVSNELADADHLVGVDRTFV